MQPDSNVILATLFIFRSEEEFSVLLGMGKNIYYVTVLMPFDWPNTVTWG